MNPQPDLPPTDEDPRLLRAVQEYLTELEAGRRPDRQTLAARFPDLAEAMTPYLDALDMVHAAAPLLPSTTGGHPASAEPLPAEPLGDFRIEREIGRGGMGVVYEAVQLSLGRRVALKVLPFAAALDAKQLQRFKNEAQAAAQLHHTNIVPVYAVGTERGVHFYAMQLIEGQNLAAVVAELRRGESGVGAGAPSLALRANGDLSSPAPDPGGETRPGLGAQLSTQRSGRGTDFYRTIARLTAQAAEALDYAHGLGIVHRDVKPANLLVDARGNVWITDFGLAQFHADANLTQTGDLLGTLRYMSPEQAGGQRVLLDHRTDVYSLGATLYELLTLRPIFDGTDRQTLLRQILNDEPRPPRSLDRAIPPELETIVLKALGKTPAERYATAREFAEDLHRFLEDRPIRARRPSPVEKVRKWARRHRGVVASGVVALLLTVAGLSAATVLAARAYDRERQKAEEADEQRARAEESFRQARRAVDQFVQLSEQELAGNPFLEGPRRRLLQAALAYYQDFLEHRRDDPTIQAELEASQAKVQTIIAELTLLMGAGKYILLQHSSVQDDLQLSQDQRQALARIDARWREEFEAFGRLAPAEWEQRRVGLARDQEAEVARLLTTEQFRRFQQIALQNRGPLAFSEPEVDFALQLTREQQKRVREIQAEAGSGGPRFGHPGGPGRPPDRAGAEWKQARDKVLALLTPEQRRKWEELTGKPFQGPMPMFFPGPPGRGGPPGGPPGGGPRRNGEE